MDQYPSNAQKPVAKEPKAADRKGRVEQVTTGKVVMKKPSIGKRFMNNLTDDDGRSVAVHIFWDLMVPAGRDMIYDAGQELLGRALGIETRGGRRTGNGMINYAQLGSTLASRVNYNRPAFLQDPREQQKAQRTPPTRGRVDLQDIVLATRVEAEEVIRKMEHLINQYGQVTIADVFDLVGFTGEYTDEKFGWLSLEGARPHHIRDGYLLDLPRPIQLES